VCDGTYQGPANRKFSFELNRGLRFEFESNLELNQGVVVYMKNEVIIIITDEQRCAVSRGSSNTIAPKVLASAYT